MYARSIRIQNLKLVRDLTLSFERLDGSVRMWTVLVGENGLGKTSLLQALGIAAAGPQRGNQLADIASLPDRRRRQAPLRIEANLEIPVDGGRKGLLRSFVELPPGVNLLKGGSEWREPVIESPDPLAAAQALRDPGPEWFVAGYGVDRQLPQPLQALETTDRLLGRLNPLFGRGPIIATGFADQFEQTLARQYARLLGEALVESHLLPKVSSLFLGGRGGVTKSQTLVEANRFSMQVGRSRVQMPANWLSQGYQAMIAWVADLVGQVVLNHGRAVPLADMTGLVLVDELDLFVHPRWQVDLIPTLKRVFPRMQFVATTHSPMLLSGLERDEVFILGQDDGGNIIAEQAAASPQLLTGSEIYDLFFGIRDLYPARGADAMRRYAQLAADPSRTGEEDQEFEQAAAELRRLGFDLGEAGPPGAGL